MAAARPRLLAHQTGQSALRKGGLGLIEGGSGEAKCLGCLANRSLIDTDQAEHFVFHLQQIAGIEELAVPKQRMEDDVGAWIKCGLLPQTTLFLVFALIYGHGYLQAEWQIACKVNYVHRSANVKALIEV